MAGWWLALWVVLALATLFYFVRSRLPVIKSPWAPTYEVPAHLRPFSEMPIARTAIDKKNWLKVHVAWCAWQQEAGQRGVFRTPITDKHTRTIIVSDPTLVGPIYSRLPKDAGYTRFHYMLSPTLPLGEGIFTSTHEDRTWRATRKFIAPFFSLPNLRSKVPIMNEKALLLCAHLRKLDGQPLESQEAMKRLTLDTFLPSGGFGFELNALDFKPCQFLADLQFVFWEAAICSLQPWRRWYFSRFPFLSKQARNFVDSHNRVYEMWDHVWTKMEEAPEPSDKDLSLTACFRRLAASEDGEHMTRQQFVWSTGGMLIAGLDSQGLTLSFTLMCLAAHSHKQALVAKELQELGLLATPENPEPRALTADDLPKLLYLDAAIKESERLLPVTGLGTARHAAQAMQIGDFWIPADTRVMLSAAIMHQDKESYAEVDSYIPERWLPDLSPEAVLKATGGQAEAGKETQMAVAKERAVRKAALSDPSAAARAKFRFATFSHGSRGCPGYGFATMQLTTVLANVIGRYKVALAPQMGGWAGCREREINAFTLMVIGGNWLTFTPRDKPLANGLANGHGPHAPEP